MFFQSLFGFGLLISVFLNCSFSWACSNAVCIGDSVIYPASDKKRKSIASPVSIKHLALVNGGKNFREHCVSTGGRVQLITDLGKCEPICDDSP